MSRKTSDLEAELYSSTHPNFRCEVEYSAFEDGRYELEIEVKHRGIEFAGPFVFTLNGVAVLTVSPGPGETEIRRTEADGAMSSPPKAGDRVELKVDGAVIAQGAFKLD